MLELLKTSIGKLRLLGIWEGISLLLLVFIAVPYKYIGGDPILVKIIGPIHGAIFIFYVIQCFVVGTERDWSFKGFTWKLIVSSFIPFGTFYTDRKYLKGM